MSLLSHLPMYLYLLSHVLLSVWTHFCLFCALGYNLMLRCFVAQVAPPRLLGALSWLLCPFDVPSSFCLGAFPTCHSRMLHTLVFSLL